MKSLRYELADFGWSIIEPLLPNKPRGVLDEADNVLARVAYNGRIFGITPGGESDYTMVLHESRGD